MKQGEAMKHLSLCSASSHIAVKLIISTLFLFSLIDYSFVSF